uniref:DUF4218 domain-containing protein n=1 Tax=Setaria italica TaxID=4555 RepID=K3Y398_SETIT
MFDAYDSLDEGGSDDDGGGSDGVDEGGDGGGDDNRSYDSSGNDELDDRDFLNQLLRHTKAELLVGSAKGLANFETVTKSAEENVYKHSKECPKHWTVLRFILELLILKAKDDWFNGSFSDLLLSINTYRAKKLVSPFMMGVERIHACPNHYILYRRDTFKGLDKYPVCSSSRCKNNSSYCDDHRQGPTDGNKRKRKGARNSVANVEPDDTTLGMSEKQSIIPALYLPYWSDLEVCHAIDGVYLNKNVFGNTIGLFLETPAKTKDTLKSRQDLVAMKIRKDLHPIDKGNGRYELPPASYNLTLDEKKVVCQLLWGIRVPSQFSSNIRNLVSMNDLLLSSYNFHDCHVMLTLFLPIAIRAIKRIYAKMVITRLCYFLNKISEKLDMCFALGFFDIMEHLMIHMVDQIWALGPLYLHEMWTYEHFMLVLEWYVLNRAYPEGSMIEGYNIVEIIESCLGYLKDKVKIGLPIPRFMGKLEGINTVGRKIIIDKDLKDDLNLPDGKTMEDQMVKRLAAGPSS